jgi:hypothetical protein
VSRGSLLKNQQEYLTKEEVVKYYSPHHLTITTTRSKQESPRNTHIKHNDALNISLKDNQRHCSHKSEQFSLARLKTKMEDYQSKWKRQI